MRNYLYKLLQQLSPQQSLTQLFGALANASHPSLKRFLIRSFMQHYSIDLQEALITDPDQYATFNAFFTRQLQPNARIIDDAANTIISPVDGKIAQIGDIVAGKMIQAKQFDFDLISLLTDATLANYFVNGKFATLYLAPHNYHRVHMPLAGKLIKTIYVPGKLFSVNLRTASLIPDLYSRNERLICIFETAIGQMAVILVGAMIVGNIQTVWTTTPTVTKTIRHEYFSGNVSLKKGEELGYFQLGSTVILLFADQTINWEKFLSVETIIRMGECIGHAVA